MSAELRATYRLQLTPNFGFSAAAELVPYLRDLGISHLYLSPSLQARAGSTHGYDVVDPTRLSDALGGEQAFRDLARQAHGAGMGIVLDVVPNHMAVDAANRFWTDPELRERFFDIDPVSGRHRRFFDIDDLAGIRIEHEEVFNATHALILRLLEEGVIDGVRVDHPDGLADPVGYLRRLRDGGAERVWVEKILASTERLPADWPVSGTVGYEFLNDVCGLFVDPAGEAPLTELWNELSGDQRPFGAYALEAKLEQARTTFAPEVERLSREPSKVQRDHHRNRKLLVQRDQPPNHKRSPGRSRRCRSTAPTTRSARARSSRAFSRQPPRSWPRASRTRPSTATAGCLRWATWAATRGASASASLTSMPVMPSARCATPRRCWRR